MWSSAKEALRCPAVRCCGVTVLWHISGGWPLFHSLCTVTRSAAGSGSAAQNAMQCATAAAT